MKKPTTIKQDLLVNNLLVIFVLSSAILAVTFFGNRQTVKQLSTTLISQSIDITHAKLTRFFRPVITELLLAQTWGQSGVLDTDKPLYLRQLFLPIMKQYPQISTLMVADSRGREFMLLRSKGYWINRITKRDVWKSRVRWYRWSNAKPEPVREWKVLDYDPRQRPWFLGAIKEFKRHHPNRSTGKAVSKVKPRAYLHWTQPYTFYTTREPGITASITYSRNDKLSHVIGLDVLLTDVSKFTTNLKPSAHGKVIVLTDDSRIIGLPKSERYGDAKAIKRDLLKKPAELKDKLIDDAIAAYTARVYLGSDVQDANSNGSSKVGPIRFKSGGQYWFVDFRQFSLSDNRSLLIAALIPETDLIGDLSHLRLWIIFVTITVMGVAIFRTFYLAKKYSQPIETLMKQSERISRGSLYEGTPVESSITEVQRLADAHEKMRVALKSLLKLESDIHLARQIQQNTFPKQVPQIAGFDIHAWSQPADETGGDTYDMIGYHYDANGKTILSDDNPKHAVILMADATGHGIGPALSANEVRAMLRMAVRTGEDFESIVRHINDQLYSDLHQGRFITAWLGLIEAEQPMIRGFSAGQAPILFYCAKQDEFKVQSADTAPFGIVPDLGIEMKEPTNLETGDIVAVISDGVFEALNTQGEKFESERVLEIIRTNKDKNCADIMVALHTALSDFTRNAPANDDKTVVLIKKL